MTSNTLDRDTAKPDHLHPTAHDTTDLPDLGTVLGVWAHPDDEAYLSSGLMLRARAAGGRVVVVTATDGELGGPSQTPLHRLLLARRRRRELALSLGILGVEEHHRLGYPDGGCSAVDTTAAVQRLAAILTEVRPDTVVTFGPDGLTGHADHRRVGSWVMEALAVTHHTARVWFPTLTAEFHERWWQLNDQVGLWMDRSHVPTTPLDEVRATVRLSGDELHRKVAALRAQWSQTAPLLDLVGEETYGQWWSTEWFREADAGDLDPVPQLAGAGREHR